MSEQTQTQLTEAQAVDVIYRGVLREIKVDGERTLAYCRDAVKLQGHNVRKLATKAQVRAEDRGEVFNADSYQSNVSNANGIMALFNYDLDAFEAWLKETTGSKSLSAIYKAFRQLFTEPKEKPAKPSKSEDTTGSTDETPQVEVVIAALAFLTPAERHMVVEACVVLGIELPEETEVEETVAA